MLAEDLVRLWRRSTCQGGLASNQVDLSSCPEIGLQYAVDLDRVWDAE